MPNRLADHVAVVTGGGAHTDRVHGIGEETCQLFAEEGATVVVVDREPEMVKQTITAIEEQGGPSPHGVAVDLTDPDDLERLAHEIEHEHGRLDVIVNNAAIRVRGPVTEAHRDSWDDIFAVNLRAIGEVCGELIPLMAASDGGSIVNVSSSNAKLARSGMAQYDAVKAGIHGLSRAMACDHAHQSIRVNAVLPGSVVTDYGLVGKELEDPESYIEERTTPRPDGPGILKRHCHPREIANAILFLANEEASFITGSCLDVNGGKTAGGYQVSWPEGPE